jgi:hypothetical protein
MKPANPSTVYGRQKQVGKENFLCEALRFSVVKTTTKTLTTEVMEKTTANGFSARLLSRLKWALVYYVPVVITFLSAS